MVGNTLNLRVDFVLIKIRRFTVDLRRDSRFAAVIDVCALKEDSFCLVSEVEFIKPCDEELLNRIRCDVELHRCRFVNRVHDSYCLKESLRGIGEECRQIFAEDF